MGYANMEPPDLRGIVDAAAVFARDIYPDAPLDGLRLEEIGFDEVTDLWAVTLSWLDPDRRGGFLPSMGRVYKVFRVDRHGRVHGMSIRELDET